MEQIRPAPVQTIATSAFNPSSPDPAGIVYMPASDRFLISDSEVNEVALYRGANLFTATRSGSGAGTGTTVSFSKEPTDLGFKPSDKTLFVSDDDSDRVFVVRPGTDGVHGTSDDRVTRFSTAAFGSTDAEGLEYDAATGHLFVCDGLGLEVYRINPVNGAFGDGNDVVRSFDLSRYSVRDCEGLGLDSQRGTLLGVDPSRKKLYELTKSGELVRTIDLSVIPTTNANFASVTVAPTSDPGDSPSAMNYWVVDRHVDNGADPKENDGLLYELSVGPVRPRAAFPGCRVPTMSVARRTLTLNTIFGTPRPDRIFGGTGDDVAYGLAGDDCIDLRAGRDRGRGGDGDDLIVGGSGRDRLSGDRGNDRLRGQTGSDRIRGDRGNDSIRGNSGRDRLNGSSGRDRLWGGSGDDRIDARDRWRDRINCGSGRDRVVADRVDRVARNCERVRWR